MTTLTTFIFQGLTDIGPGPTPEAPVRAAPIPAFEADPVGWFKANVHPRIKAPGGRDTVFVFEPERKPRTPDEHSDFNQYIPCNSVARFLADARKKTALLEMAAAFPLLRFAVYWSANGADNGDFSKPLSMYSFPDVMVILNNLYALDKALTFGNSSRLYGVFNDGSAWNPYSNDNRRWDAHRDIDTYLAMIMPQVKLFVEGPVPVTLDPVTHHQSCTMWSAMKEQPARPDLAMPMGQTGAKFTRLLHVQAWQFEGEQVERTPTVDELRECMSRGMIPMSQRADDDALCAEAMRPEQLERVRGMG